MNLDEFLNFVIPLALLVVALAWGWYKFNEPLKRFFEWIKQLFGAGASRVSEATQAATQKEIVWQ